MAIPDDTLNTIRDEFGLGPDAIVTSSWEDRVVPAAYTPPSGVRITFDFEDISYKFKKKTSAFNFPDVDGTLVQDHGVGDHQFPMRCYLSGPNYDQQALVFEAALMERGVGKFESPLYGTHDVVVFDDVTRRDDLKTGANQAIFDVVFFKTIGVAYPTGQTDPANAALTALDLFGSASDADFAASIDVISVAEQTGLLDVIGNLTSSVESNLKSVAAVQESVAGDFQDAIDTVNNTIDVLVAQPLTLAFETRRMIQLPATALASIAGRLEAYGNLATIIFSRPDAVSEPGGVAGLGPHIDSNAGVGNDSQEPNKFHSRDQFIGNYVAGAALSVLYTNTDQGGANSVNAISKQQSDAADEGVTGGGSTFETAGQALTAAETLLTQWAAYVVWRDLNYVSLSGGNLTVDEQANFISAPSNLDPGNAYLRLQEFVALTAGFLIDLSFSLKRRRALITDRPRSVVDLCYEIYGSVDDTLDFFIDSNGLAVSQILEIPMGTKIVYYV